MIERLISSDGPQTPPAKRTKDQSSLFAYSADMWKMQSMVYAKLAAVDRLYFNPISTNSFIRNSIQQKYKVVHTSHTTIPKKVKESCEVAKEETVVDLKKL